MITKARISELHGQQEVMEQLLKDQAHRCAYCGRRIGFTTRNNIFKACFHDGNLICSPCYAPYYKATLHIEPIP